MDETDFLNRRLGQTLRGKWTLERLLGWGGMAAVYVGLHHIGRRDAIKILHQEVAVAPDIRARFEQEAHAVNHLRHPGVVEVRDIDLTDDGCPFLVMELLEGESLASVLEKQERLDPSLMLQYVDEVLDVLVAAHAGGIIHRDIKPDNLFVCGSGRIKVLDFGVARMKEGAPRTLATRTGMAVGTLTYMAPEQVRGVHVDARADVFAVGATMFRCIARRRIHDGATEADLLIKMATVPAPPLRTVAAEVSPDLALVVDRALQFDMAQRYPDAATMQGDVRALMRGERPPFAISAPLAVPATIPGTATIPATIPGGVPRGLAGGDLPTRMEVPAPRVEPTAGSILQQAPSVEPTLVEAASAVSMVESRDQRNKGPLLALIFGALGAMFLLVLGAGAVAWWVLSEDDPSTGEASASSASAGTREITTLFGETSDTATTATRVVPPGVLQPPTATLPPATTLPPTSTATVPPTTTLPPPTTTTLPPTATSPLATLIPPLPTATAPATTPPQPSIPPATAPPATSPPPKDDKKKDKGKGKGKDR
jgi:serine/threonine-protein kinase